MTELVSTAREQGIVALIYLVCIFHIFGSMHFIKNFHIYQSEGEKLSYTRSDHLVL